jgi:hypothetical protein
MGKRRVPIFDTIAVRGAVWIALALVLIAPIAATRLQAPAVVHHALPPAARSPAPPPPPPPSPSPPVADSAGPSDPSAPAPAARAPNVGLVRDRLAAILREYQNRNDFGTPDSGVQAAGALHWCAQQLAGYEHISASDASRALSRALIEPSSAEGLRVVSAIEARAEGADETSRMHCASLLYAQLQN